MTQGAEGTAHEIRLPRPPGGPTAWALGAAVMALVLVAVVTASGPVDVVSAPLRGAAPSLSLSPPPTTTTTRATTTTPDLASSLRDLPPLSPVVIAVIQLVVALVVGWILALLARYAWRSFPRMSTRAVARGPLTPLPAVPDELVDTADARMALLQEGSPRNAIVACWVDLEDSASAAGLPRRPSETAAEYTVRVLRTWDIAPDAMGALAELYREARYSRHSLTEDHRAAAVERLTAIHDDLQRVAAAQDAAAETGAGSETGSDARRPVGPDPAAPSPERRTW